MKTLSAFEQDIASYKVLRDEIEKLQLFAKHIAKADTEVNLGLTVVDLVRKKQTLDKLEAKKNAPDNEDRITLYFGWGGPKKEDKEENQYTASIDSILSDSASFKIIAIILEEKMIKARVLEDKFKQLGIEL